jgi:serine/threonine protein phosphatase 1
MLSRLLKSRNRAAALPAIPDGIRVYAIGDIHGRADLLDAMLGQIAADDAARPPARRVTLFLGDLVDRGPDSAGVIERLIALRDRDGDDVRFIMGNHEEIFLKTLAGEDKATRLFCRIGGRETLLSYGLTPADYERLDYAEVVDTANAIVPTAHRAFMEGFEDLVTFGDYAFVHAGVRPGVAFADQRPAELRWIRDPFLDHRGALEKIVVHGHTVADTVEILPHRIGLDTGAYDTGRLSAIRLEATDRLVFST